MSTNNNVRDREEQVRRQAAEIAARTVRSSGVGEVFSRAISQGVLTGRELREIFQRSGSETVPSSVRDTSISDAADALADTISSPAFKAALASTGWAGPDVASFPVFNDTGDVRSQAWAAAAVFGSDILSDTAVGILDTQQRSFLSELASGDVNLYRPDEKAALEAFVSGYTPVPPAYSEFKEYVDTFVEKSEFSDFARSAAASDSLLGDVDGAKAGSRSASSGGREASAFEPRELVNLFDLMASKVGVETTLEALAKVTGQSTEDVAGVLSEALPEAKGSDYTLPEEITQLVGLKLVKNNMETRTAAEKAAEVERPSDIEEPSLAAVLRELPTSVDIRKLSQQLDHESLQRVETMFAALAANDGAAIDGESDGFSLWGRSTDAVTSDAHSAPSAIAQAWGEALEGAGEVYGRGASAWGAPLAA